MKAIKNICSDHLIAQYIGYCIGTEHIIFAALHTADYIAQLNIINTVLIIPPICFHLAHHEFLMFPQQKVHQEEYVLSKSAYSANKRFFLKPIHTCENACRKVIIQIANAPFAPFPNDDTGDR